MPKGLCQCCRKIKTVTEVSISRRWSKEKIDGGLCCKECWEGYGPSSPVVYYP